MAQNCSTSLHSHYSTQPPCPATCRRTSTQRWPGCRRRRLEGSWWVRSKDNHHQATGLGNPQDLGLGGAELALYLGLGWRVGTLGGGVLEGTAGMVGIVCRTGGGGMRMLFQT